MTEPFFGRTIVASVTPFDENLDLDLTRAQELAERFVEAGVDSIAVCPTTGECPTVFYDDKIRLFEAVLEAVNGRCKTIAYVGDNCTQDTVDFAKKVEPMGFDGYLCCSVLQQTAARGSLPALQRNRQCGGRPHHAL